ncbi:MAG: ParB/RepB/Spo0J family partition protein [Bacteroidota bacterium]|jgi:ParB family chromosome partitioning protein
MSKVKKPTGLGKGLSAILPDIKFSDEGIAFTSQASEEVKGSIALIEVSMIEQNPYQPRKDFDKEALESLALSIREHGVIQPVVVRKAVSGYELIAGERRLRATIAAGNTKIPAYIMELESPVDSLTLAIIENVQRENLNPIEVAHGYQRLIDECHLTQEQVSAKVSKDRATVANFLRLLKLPDAIQESLRRKEVTMGHARAILALVKPKTMLAAWREVVEKGLNVRATESLVRDIDSGKIQLDGEGVKKKSGGQKLNPEKQHVTPEIALVLEDAENKLMQIFGTKVKISTKSKESGTFEFEFYSKDDFERLIDLFSSVNNE